MRKSIFLFIMVMFTTAGCDIQRQVQEMKTLAKCEFRVATVENVKLAGVDVQKINSASDLTFMDMTKIGTAYMSGNLPLSMTLNMDIKNPNTTKAAMNRMQWILEIDNVQMTSGVVEERVEVSPNGGIARLPLNVSANLKEVLSGKSKDALINLAANLSGQNNQPSNLTLKVKPTIVVGNRQIDYPGYINVKHEFTSR